MATKKRKFNEEYISCGLNVKLDRDGTEKPQCFYCGKVPANSSMKPVKLKEHQNGNHLPETFLTAAIHFCKRRQDLK